MANYSVCIMIPFSVVVEANSFEEAIDKHFNVKKPQCMRAIVSLLEILILMKLMKNKT